MLYATVLGIHVCAMSAALLSFVAGELLLILARRGRRPVARLALFASSAGNFSAGLGVLAGIFLVVAGGWSLLTPWLLASLALIAALMAVGRRFVHPWEARIRSALASDTSGTQVKALASETSALLGRAAVIAMFVLVAGLMTVKPALALP
jgi:hypothetical protein